MKKIVLIFSCWMLFMARCPADPSLPAKNSGYEWTNRLELTLEQQQLLRLYMWFEDASNPEMKREQFRLEAERLAEKLGANRVRRAKPSELIVTKDKSGVESIFNPSDENLAFTVSVKGDEQWMGTRKASIGRQTYLPPLGTLRVPNLYWTSPRMTQKE